MRKLALLFAALVTLSSQTHAQIGSLDKDLVFTPVVPCRVFDTRYQQGGSGSINAGDTKLFTIAGYASQVVLGGADSDCGMLGLYDEVAALAINITVIEPLSAGWITAYPGGQAKPVVQQLISKRVTLLEMRLLLKHHKLTQLILPYSPLAKLT